MASIKSFFGGVQSSSRPPTPVIKMRETRSRTGKLPPPKPPAEEFRTPSPEPEPMPADVATPPTPSSKRVRASKASSSKSKSKSKSKKIVEEELVEVIEEAPRPVFETFETDVTLQDGLSIVRALGGGKYEIINLKHVDPDAITSAETGAVIKADKKLLKAMDIDDLEWQVAKFKVNQAVGSANSTFFRFRKLPIELRYKVYDFAIVGAKPLHHIDREFNKEPRTLGLELMQTSRQMYQETRPFFYRNTFRISDMSKQLKPIVPEFRKFLREVEFEWWGWSLKDPNLLRWFQTCENLKIFHLVVTKYCTNSIHNRRQWLYQGDFTIKKWSGTNGFDALVQLRGLERVEVRHAEAEKKDNATDAEIADFQTFLTGILTLPKPEPVRNIPVTRATAAVNKNKKKSYGYRPEDDDEYKD